MMRFVALLPIIGAFSPIIGIVAQPPSNPMVSDATGTYIPPGSYVISSYIKWVEALGADVAILRFDVPEALHQARKVHGILLPGGTAPTALGTPYGDFSFALFKMALDIGIPIWGTCLGFEQILSYTHDALNLTDTPLQKSRFDANGLALPFITTPEGAKNKWWTSLPAESRNVLVNEPTTLNFHNMGFAVDDFKNSSAASVWDLVATNVDRNNADFVSVAIMKTHRAWALQFHPEKNAFEHHGFDDVAGVDVPSRSRAAIQAMQDIAHDFIDAARARPFGWSVAEMQAWSIDNWTQLSSSEFPSARKPDWDSFYLFPPYKDDRKEFSQVSSFLESQSSSSYIVEGIRAS